MAKILKIFILVGLFIVLTFNEIVKAGPEKKDNHKYVKIETPYGNMKVMLYNETPIHRDNFIKLAGEGFYDSLLFHRVIKDFMIQGGDPDSKNAPAGKQLGNGGPGYEIPAEFVPALFHKKGVIAAAREGDRVNPDKKSSGSQFYIVQGSVVTPEQLAQIEERINMPKKQKIFSEFIMNPANAKLKAKLDSLNQVRDVQSLNAEIQKIGLILEPDFEKAGLFKYTDEQKKIYSSVGGTPHLDQNYTVFGEVVEGLNVIDSIAQVKTDKYNRPLRDIRMKISVVK